jgi:hypothetical protein
MMSATEGAMMQVALQAALVALFASAAFAADVYGTITDGDRPVANRPVLVTCYGTVYPTTTDRFGSYRVPVPRAGQCQLQLGDPPTRPLAIHVYDRPQSYDLVLQKDLLRRR